MNEDEVKTAMSIFSGAVFIANPGTWYDSGTEVKLLDVFGWSPSGQPWGLFSGKKDGNDDEETCPFSEFSVTWPDESV